MRLLSLVVSVARLLLVGVGNCEVIYYDNYILKWLWAHTVMVRCCFIWVYENNYFKNE